MHPESACFNTDSPSRSADSTPPVWHDVVELQSEGGAQRKQDITVNTITGSMNLIMQRLRTAGLAKH